MGNINQLSKQWRVQFNPTKTEFMYFILKRNILRLYNLYFDNTPVQKTDTHTHLGLALNEILEWRSQVNEVTSKVAKTLNSMKRIKNFVPRSTLEIRDKLDQ